MNVSKEIIYDLFGQLLDSGITSEACLHRTERDLNILVNNVGPNKVQQDSANIIADFRERLQKVAEVESGHQQEQLDIITDMNAALCHLSDQDVYDVATQVRRMILDFVQPAIPSSQRKKGAKRKKNGGNGAYTLKRRKISTSCEIRSITLRHSLEVLLDGDDVLFILDCLRRGQPRQVSAFGMEMPAHQQLMFFEALMKYDPGDPHFVVLYGKAAKHTNDTEKVTFALKKMLSFEPDENFLPSTASFARAVNDRVVMHRLVQTMDDYQNNPFCLVAYVGMIMELDDRPRMRKVIKKVEKNLADLENLKIYAKLARKLRLYPDIHTSMDQLEQHLDDPYCLKQYAMCAYFMRSEREMRIAYAYTKDLLEDPWFLRMHASISISLEDWEGLAMVHLLLRQNMNDAANRRSFNDVDAKIREVSKRKKSQKSQDSNLDHETL